MTSTLFRLVAIAAAGTMISTPISAQTAAGTTVDPTVQALANATALASINSTNAATANAKTDEDLKFLTAIQGLGAGTGGGDSSQKTAEALLVSHYALSGAAQKLAKDIAGSSPATPILIVWGTAPPSLGQFVQFQHDRDMIREALVSANLEWDAALQTAAAKPVRHPKKPAVVRGAPRTPGPAPASDAGSALLATVGGSVASASPVGLAITAAATLASLGRVDTTVNGLDVANDQEQDRSIVETALRAEKLPVDVVEFDLPSTPSDHDLGMDDLASGASRGVVTPYDAAYHAYYGGYLPKWAAAGGKTDKMPANIVSAGADLLTAIQADQSFRKATFASTNGVSGASVIFAEMQLATKRVGKSLLYLRNMRAAASVRNNKGFFVGITRSPSDFEGAASIDYLLVASSQATAPVPASGSAEFWTGVVHLWKLKQFLADYPQAGAYPGINK